MTFYHGGNAGIADGDRIEPPSKTGARSTADIAQEDAASGMEYAQPAHVAKLRKDVIYVTPMFKIACLFASAHPKPTVYQVQPIGLLEADPDWFGEPGLSLMCKAAVVEISGPLTQHEARIYRALLNADS